MKNIVIIGANDFQLPLILEAKSRGYTTHVFAWQCDDKGEKEADYFYPISVTDIEKIYKVCLDIHPDAICSIASDLTAITVNELSKRFNLSHNDSSCVKNTTNKYAMRQALANANLPVPKFKIVDSPIDNLDFDFPVIVKPTDRSGSRGINKVESKEELATSIASSIEYSFEKKAIIEEYIDGEEYSFEAFAYNGSYTYLAITKKYTTGAPHFIETGHIEPSGLTEKTIEEIKSHIFLACKALNIQNSAIHAEFKLSSLGIRVIEIGARMGGDCIGSHLVHISTGYNFVGIVLDIALNIAPTLVQTRTPKHALIRFLFNQKDIDTLNILQDNIPECIELISIEKDLKHEIVDSASRYGFYILALDSMEQLEGIKSNEH